MSDAIICSIISAAVTLTGTIITIVLTAQKQTAEIDKKLAVQDTEIKVMSSQVKEHNGYAKMFSENIPAIKQHMVDVDRRLEKLERKE